MDGKTLQSIGKRARVHLKIDTGMERIGAPEYETRDFLARSAKSDHLEIIGIYSHLACADDPESPMTYEQLKRFNSAIEYFQEHSSKKLICHLANSGGILHFPETFLDMVRPGIILYGVVPDPKSHKLLNLKPALSLKARVVYSKTVKAGSPISYGATSVSYTHLTLPTICSV